jgi:predicted carbohydrate-binding protein with CBM5 and CBM33 domain
MNLKLNVIGTLSLSLLKEVASHGYMSTPRTRNWVAAQDGVDWGSHDNLPPKEVSVNKWQVFTYYLPLI